MKKLLFFDMGETLAHPSTGCTAESIPPTVETIGFDGGIFSAGGIVMLEQAVLAQHFMSDQISQAVISLLEERFILYALETACGQFSSNHASDVLSKTDMTGVSEEMQSTC